MMWPQGTDDMCTKCQDVLHSVCIHSVCLMLLIYFPYLKLFREIAFFIPVCVLALTVAMMVSGTGVSV